MNFDKFKELKPKPIMPPAESDSYSEKLITLKSRPSAKKILSVVSSVAAAVAIITAVTIWAIIGRGIRMQGQQVPVEVPGGIPEDEPTIPSDTLIKDESITILQKKKFFEMFAEYKINAMPDFSQTNMPYIDKMMWYIFHLCPNDINSGRFPLDVFNEKTSELFGYQYDWFEEDYPLGEGQLQDYPFAELIRYREEETDEGTVVTATAAVYYIWNLSEQNCKELYPLEYTIAKSAIISGNGNINDISAIYQVKYLIARGSKPQRFLSLEKYVSPTSRYMEFFDYGKDEKIKAEYEYEVTNDGSINVTRHTYDQYQTNIEVPEFIDDKPVITVSDMAFYQHEETKSIVIPKSVTSIVGAVFYRCYSLEEFYIPESVISITTNPFFRASSLKKIEVDDDNPRFCDIDGVLFNKDATKLLAYPEGKADEEYTVPESVTSIDISAFGYSPKVKRITILSNVTDIPYNQMFTFPGDITLIVEKGSAAEQHAIRHNIKYELIN